MAEPARPTGGALGEVRFQPGWYTDAGIAGGPGGFARVARHREVAAGDRAIRHWHLHALLGHEAAAVDGDVRTPGVDGECRVAAAGAGETVEGFGCSDCDCRSHRHRYTEPTAAVDACSRAHTRLEPSGEPP